MNSHLQSDALDFIHHFVPGPSGPAHAPTLLLLHGTGGNENDLLDFGRSLLPGASLLSPRGKILEHGQPRFFRRLAEGVFDEADLLHRTDELAGFVRAAAASYAFDPSKVIALGYSNGANIAASLILRHPEILRGAVLLRAMPPFAPERSAVTSGTSEVLLLEGRHDPLVTPGQAQALEQMLAATGARATLRWLDAGHQLTAADWAIAKEWLERPW